MSAALDGPLSPEVEVINYSAATAQAGRGAGTPPPAVMPATSGEEDSDTDADRRSPPPRSSESPPMIFPKMLALKGSVDSLQDGEVARTATLTSVQSTPSASPRPRLSAFSGGVLQGKSERGGALDLPCSLPVLSLTPSASPSAPHPEHQPPPSTPPLIDGDLAFHPETETPPSPPLSIDEFILKYADEKENKGPKGTQRLEEEEVFCTPAETPAQMESYFTPRQAGARHRRKSLSNDTPSEWESVIGKFEGMVDRLATLSQQRPGSAQRRRGRTGLSNSASSSDLSLRKAATTTPLHSLPSPISARSGEASDSRSTGEIPRNDSGTAIDDKESHDEVTETKPHTPPARPRTFQRSRSNSAPQSRISHEDLSAEAFARLFDDTFMAAVQAEQLAPTADVSMSTDRTLTNDPAFRHDTRPQSHLLLAQAALTRLNEDKESRNQPRSVQGRSWRSDPSAATQTSMGAHSRDATTSTMGDSYVHSAAHVAMSRIGPGFTHLPNPELSIFDDPRGSHNILFEYVVEPGRNTITKVLLAATKVKLVEYLTCDADPEFVVDFFITYRAFMSSRYLLNLLTLRIRWCFAESDRNQLTERQSILDKSLRVLLFWVHHHADADFSPSRTLRATLGTFLQTHILSNPYFSSTFDDIMEAISREKQRRRERKQAIARRALVHAADVDRDFSNGRSNQAPRAHGRPADPQQPQNEYLDSGSRPYPFFASARPSLDSIPRPSMTSLQVSAPAERTWKSWLFRRRGHRNPSSQSLAMTAGTGTSSQNTSTSTVSSTGQSTSTRGSGPSLHTSSSSGALVVAPSRSAARSMGSSTLYRPFVLDYPAHAVAQHFCTIEQQHVVDIPWLQLLMTEAWRVRNEWGQEVAGQVWKAVDRFNATCYWVATEIFKVDSNEERAAVVEAFIRIAQTSLAYNNYSTLLAILLAFKTVDIDKLVPIWTCVGSVEKTMFVTLRNFCNPAKGFRKIRSAHGRCCEGIVLDWSAGHTPISQTRDVYGAVPFLGIFLNDLAYLEEVDWFLDPFVMAANPSSDSLPFGASARNADMSGPEYARQSQLLFGTRPYRRTANAADKNSDRAGDASQRNHQQSPTSSSERFSANGVSPSRTATTTASSSRLVNVRRATRTAAVVRSFRAFQHPDRAYTGPPIDCGPELDAGVKTLSGVVE
ncbi:hypothetical protein HDU88_007509 [Geranomyces variabilis]|nr:hypothetical protein HDU88_007509 [Geranomyces variabilis]